MNQIYRHTAISCLLLISQWLWSQQSYHRTEKLMGCRFDLTVVAEDSISGQGYLDMAVDEIKRIEALISSWSDDSETTEINRKSGIAPVPVSEELFALIERSLGISELTSGAFDISFASIDKVWKFDGSMERLPSEGDIKASVALIDYRKIKLDEADHSVFLPVKGMRIGFGAIGKGYAADQVKRLLMAQGVSAGIINASGDLTAWGSRPDGEPWKVAITNPLDKSKAFAWLPIEDGAVVTSGNYEKYVMIDGTRYSHIIDPRTGYPSKGVNSVTVFAPKAELADALATAVFVMGVDVGMDLIRQIPQVECIIVDEQNRVHATIELHDEKSEQ
jgi:thiamine biosynthesis lipoprotein